MAVMAEVPISPKVLRWARQYRGFDRATAAERFGISEEELAALENDEKKPTVTLFRRIAQRLQLPRATLARQTPPAIPPDPIDFRTLEGRPPDLGFNTRVVISRIHSHQTDILELAEDDPDFRELVLPEYSRPQSDPWELGRAERERLGITVGAQLEWANVDEAFRHWRAALEAAGVFVFVETFDLQDCRGFSVYEDVRFPTIIVNRNDHIIGARIFTLIHEYAHLLIREPGISDLNHRHPVEGFCNKFAAGFLMPDQALALALPYWPNEPVEWTEEEVRVAARTLKVTQQALALRLEEAGVAPAGFFDRYVARQGVWEPQPQEEGAGGGNYVNTQFHTLGSRFVGAVLSAVDRRLISSVEASEMLHLAPRHFPTIRERLNPPILIHGGA